MVETKYGAYDDNELMDALKRGTTAAYEELVERYRKRAYHIALGLVGDSDEAYDISQEAFIRVYRAARRFDRERSFFSWFYTILANLARNHLRRRQVRSEYRQRSRGEYDGQTECAASPDTLIEADETKFLVWDAIGKLSYDHREIIVLRHFEDLSYEEIAGMLSIPVGSVMSRLYYARKKLKELLGNEFER